jgi:hypothetical protein
VLPFLQYEETEPIYHKYYEVSSVLDPDSHGSALILVGWILIHEGKSYPQKRKKEKQFYV